MKRTLVRAWARAKIKGLENINSFRSLLAGKKRVILLSIFIVLGILLFWSYIKALLIMLAFIALGVASLYHGKFIKFPLGVELNMLGIVIIGKLYGAIPAILVGIITLFIGELITERLTHSTVISFLGIIIVGLLIPAMPESWSITELGIVLVIVYDAIIIPLYILLGSSIGRSAFFLITHIVFNVWVFAFIAPSVFRILG